MHLSAEVLQKAREAQNRALAPYSRFQVGAVLVTAAGRMFPGCNIEVSSYSLTICAERVALFSALAAGEREFQKLVIVTDSDDFCPPCGACRQVLWDFAPELEIFVVNRQGDWKVFLLRDLFPDAFDANFLPGGEDRE